MNYRDFLQKLIYAIINPLIHGLIKLHVTPNMITTLGFLGNIG
ncbi:MAG: CDP-alcohol phosphatidyltransferase family protein, partial [Prevotellaceae bacterium]|nr:CDP-alcohol phosphatidyltransferase family protein [Prevotellaceae bacterium]